MKTKFVVAFSLIASLGPLTARADSTAQTLPFTQNWSNPALIVTDDIWSGVPGFIGYRGDGLTPFSGTDPATIFADGTGTPVDVIANQTNPNTQNAGGLAEFDGGVNPVVALQGSTTASAPFLLLNLTTTGQQNLTVSYNLRDLDGSVDNSVQPVALHYRVGNVGSFINVAAAFVADASSGPSLATLVTPVTFTLPAALDNQPLIQIRWMTANAVGSDEWIGIDDITVTGEPYVPAPARYSITWQTTDGGGSRSTGGTFALSSTAGQPEASPEPATGGSFALTGGFWSFLAVQTPGAPLISVERLEADMRVFWPRPATGFVLDQSLTVTGTWSQVAFPYTTNATDISITVLAPTGHRFYRLRKL